MIVVRKKSDYKIGYKISACFNVSQKESYILSQFKKHLRCGTLRTRSDGVSYFEVNNLTAITENVIPFFDHLRFISANKKFQYSKFCQAVKCLENKEHLTPEGFDKIIQIRQQMNRGGKSSRKNFTK